MINALALTGPTASGKTALSIQIAKDLDCEIICLDSMQIYKRMDIGTAKATREERREVPHYMLDFLSPADTFSAKAYKNMALEFAKDISSRGKTPLFVGGTGLYLSTLMRPDCEEPPESNPEYRRQLEKNLNSDEEKKALHERLRQIDPKSAQTIHYNNTRRVIRALEVFDATGKTKTYFDELTHAKNNDIYIEHVTLDFHNRENLYNRCNIRVDEMIKQGLFDEVKALLSEGLLKENTTAAQAIGYKEMIDVVLEKASLTDATEAIKQATRNYAKRQLTWFRRMESASVLYVDSVAGDMLDFDNILNECKQKFTNKG